MYTEPTGIAQHGPYTIIQLGKHHFAAALTTHWNASEPHVNCRGCDFVADWSETVQEVRSYLGSQMREAMSSAEASLALAQREGWNVHDVKSTPDYVHVALAVAASKIAQDMDDLGLENMVEEYRARRVLHLDALTNEASGKKAMTELMVNPYALRHASRRVRRMYGASASKAVEEMYGFHQAYEYSRRGEVAS
jgi:hypothetical protein